MIEKFMIENESEADEYLNDLFLKKEFRSMDVVVVACHRIYF